MLNCSCDQFDFVNCLWFLDRLKHQGIMFKCEVCAKEYKTEEQVRQHRLVFHEGVWYNCHSYDLKLTYNINVKIHIQS